MQQRVWMRAAGLAALLAFAGVSAVHMSDSDTVSAGGGGHEPCMVYADAKTEGDHPTSSVDEPECPPFDCEHSSIGYVDDQGNHGTWKPPECQPGSTPKPTHPPTHPPSTPCTSAWVDEHGNAHSYDNCGTTPSTIKQTTTSKPGGDDNGTTTTTIKGGGGSSTSTTLGGGGSSSTTTTCVGCVPNTQVGGGTTTSTIVSPPPPPPGGSTTSTTQPRGGIPPGNTGVVPPITGPATVEIFLRDATSVCQVGVPKIQIDFGNETQFNGRVGTLTMSDINGNIISVQSLTYQANTTVYVLYPGTVVDANGVAVVVPGWVLNSDGFWIQDPANTVLRQGINLLYEVNPSATAFVTYPPESSGCATPTGPFPPVQQRNNPTVTTKGLPVTE